MYIFSFLFIWVFTARQDYFSNFEPSQTIGGVKMGPAQEKPPDHPKAELSLSHMWPELDSNLQWWDDKRFRALKISVLNHSSTDNLYKVMFLSTEYIGQGGNSMLSVLVISLGHRKLLSPRISLNSLQPIYCWIWLIWLLLSTHETFYRNKWKFS